jgi:predicted nucleotidyltransferase component of viral defense system
MSEKDYRKLYLTQDKVLLKLKPVLSSFYLTGGTALGRFYLNHRFSEDLDFFMNQSVLFNSTLLNIEKVLTPWQDVMSRKIFLTYFQLQAITGLTGCRYLMKSEIRLL